MIGTILSLGAILLLATTISLDIFYTFTRISSNSNLKKIVTQSSNYNLLLYELPFFLLMMGFPLFVEESQNPILRDIYPSSWLQFLIWIPTVLLLAFVNIVRFERSGIDKRNERSVYLIAEEIIKNDRTPEEGIDSALIYIKNCSNKFRAVSEIGFLQYLASKDNPISMIAKRKIDE